MRKHSSSTLGGDSSPYYNNLAPHLVYLLRPELVRTNPVPLSSDAFSRFGLLDGDTHNAAVDSAFRRLMRNVVPSVAAMLEEREAYQNVKALVLAPGTNGAFGAAGDGVGRTAYHVAYHVAQQIKHIMERPNSNNTYYTSMRHTSQSIVAAVAADGQMLTRALHQHGVNMRFLGHVRRCSVLPEWRSALRAEAVARCIKSLIRECMRETMQRTHRLAVVTPFLTAVADTCNQVFGATPCNACRHPPHGCACMCDKRGCIEAQACRGANDKLDWWCRVLPQMLKDRFSMPDTGAPATSRPAAGTSREDEVHDTQRSTSPTVLETEGQVEEDEDDGIKRSRSPSHSQSFEHGDVGNGQCQCCPCSWRRLVPLPLVFARVKEMCGIELSPPTRIALERAITLSVLHQQLQQLLYQQQEEQQQQQEEQQQQQQQTSPHQNEDLPSGDSVLATEVESTSFDKLSQSPTMSNADSTVTTASTHPAPPSAAAGDAISNVQSVAIGVQSLGSDGIGDSDKGDVVLGRRRDSVSSSAIGYDTAAVGFRRQNSMSSMTSSLSCYSGTTTSSNYRRAAPSPGYAAALALANPNARVQLPRLSSLMSVPYQQPQQQPQPQQNVLLLYQRQLDDRRMSQRTEATYANAAAALLTTADGSSLLGDDGETIPFISGEGIAPVRNLACNASLQQHQQQQWLQRSMVSRWPASMLCVRCLSLYFGIDTHACL
jgi:hypothetical protein